MESNGPPVVLVPILVAGAAVWFFTTSPLFALVALLGGLLLWEAARRARYGQRLRFVRPPSTRPAVGDRDGRSSSTLSATGATAVYRRSSRPLWHRAPGAPRSEPRLWNRPRGATPLTRHAPARSRPASPRSRRP